MKFTAFIDRKPHGGDLLLLGHDDLLGQPLDLRVATVAKHRYGHVDCALMVRHHHSHEVDIDVTRGLHRHVVHHFFHGRVVLGQERCFLGHLGIGCRAHARRRQRSVMGRNKECGSDDESDHERDRPQRDEMANWGAHPDLLIMFDWPVAIMSRDGILRNDALHPIQSRAEM
jgi:hypothetical protein